MRADLQPVVEVGQMIDEFGLIERTVSGTWEYREWWAHDPEQEAEATAALIDHLGWLGIERIPFSPLKLLGIALLAVGAWILLN